MNAPRYAARIICLCITCTFLPSTWAALPVVATKQDGQVLEAVLFRVFADPEFGNLSVHTNGAVIVLHARTPEKTGFLRADQMRSDIGTNELPRDAEQDLRRRNTPLGAKSDTYDSVTAYFTNLTFRLPIVVADLTENGNQPLPYRSFGKTHPKARGWLDAYLPGYSKDGSRAIVRAGVGPSAHGAMVTALVEKSGKGWVVKWHHIAWYA